MMDLHPIAARTLLPALCAALLLAACSGKAPPPDAVRTVLVVQPGAAGDMAVQAFAGDVHARQESPLAFRVGGNLVRRLVDAGDAVKQGQLLAELDPGDQALQAGAARAQAAAAEAELARVRADLARYKALLDKQLVSRSSYDAQLAAYKAAQGQADAARAQAGVAGNQAGYTRLRAPRDGVVATRQAEAGQVVAAGQTIFTLAGDGAREVAIQLPESRIRDIHTGQPAWVELWSQPGQRYAGRVREIGAVADPQTRTYAARVALDASDGEPPGLGQSARVYIADQAGGLRVPLAALQPAADGGKSVWLVDAGGKLHARRVQVGDYGPDSVPVQSGLSPGDWVVAGGGHLLREGERVRPVDRRNRPVAVQAAAAAPQAR